MTDYERLLAEENEDELRARPLDDLRAVRDECQAVETGLSYLRRMVQAPLDIATREQDRRRGGGAAGDVSSLVDELPSILAEHGSRGDGGRLPGELAPSRVDPELEAELAALLERADVADLPGLDDAGLDAQIAALREFEARVSTLRQAFFTRIDALNGELTRRYGSGEASVDSLLR